MPLHLRKRAGVWHYSRTVPRDIRGVIGKPYWRETLDTRSLREAEAARSILDTKHQSLIDDIRRLTDSQRVAAIRRVHPAKPLEDAHPADNGTALRLPKRKNARALRLGVQTHPPPENLNELHLLGPSPAADLPESEMNPRLKEALERWLKENGQKPVTARKYRLHIRRLSEYTANATISSLTPGIIKGFVAAYAELPNARTLKLAQRKLTLPELLALRMSDLTLPSIGAANVRKMIEYLRAFLRGIGKDELASYAKKPKDDRPHAKKIEGYPPFQPEQVRALLELAGNRWGAQSDTTWWVWLMAYSGLRPEEAAQVARANVIKQNGIWSLLIDDLEQRKIKNAQSLRIIPIHPILIDRGFLDFAKAEQTVNGLVFDSFEYDDKGGRSNNPSRRLKRLINMLGIKGSGSAHRFRATFIDAIRNAQLSYAIEIGLVGHGDKNRVHGRYGEGVSLKTVASVIGRVDPLSD